MTHPTDEELDALLRRLNAHKHWGMTEEAFDAITALRAQLAEMRAEIRVTHACNRGLVRLNEATQARADRAEAALAAQIEADAGIAVKETAMSPQFNVKDQWRASIGEEVATAIRAQPHDRTALDRMLREAILEGMRIATFTPIEQVPSAVDAAILAMIEQEPPHD